MLPAQRVLRVAAPATLLSIFGLWFFTVPPSGKGDAARSRFQNSTMGHRQPPSMQSVNVGTQRDLEVTVTKQLAALKKGDYSQALRFSAGSFRESITPRQFGTMIERGYSPLAVCRKATFGSARRHSDTAEMAVTVEGRDGSRAEYLYQFTREAGAWRIATVVPYGQVSPPPSPLRRASRAAQQ